jgi:hypothetical protein
MHQSNLTTSRDEWLAENTFYCERLRARLTPEQCRRNRERPEIDFNEDRPMRPRECNGCPGQPKMEKKVMPRMKKATNPAVWTPKPAAPTVDDPGTITLPSGEKFTPVTVRPASTLNNTECFLVHKNKTNACLQFSVKAADSFIKNTTFVKFYKGKDENTVLLELLTGEFTWPSTDMFKVLNASKKRVRSLRISAMRLLNAGVLFVGRYSLERIPGRENLLLAKKVG